MPKKEKQLYNITITTDAISNTVRAFNVQLRTVLDVIGNATEMYGNIRAEINEVETYPPGTVSEAAKSETSADGP